MKLPNGFVLEFDNLALARSYNVAWRRLEGSSRALIGSMLPTREAVDARYAVVADPNGNDVGLMSPQDDVHRSWPPKESPAR